MVSINNEDSGLPLNLFKQYLNYGSVNYKSGRLPSHLNMQEMYQVQMSICEALIDDGANLDVKDEGLIYLLNGTNYSKIEISPEDGGKIVVCPITETGELSGGMDSFVREIMGQDKLIGIVPLTMFDAKELEINSFRPRVYTNPWSVNRIVFAVYQSILQRKNFCPANFSN